MDEIWKDIEGYEGYYQVSNFGRVKSLAGRKRRELILKLDKKSNGYMQVHLCKNGKVKILHVHRLVALAFIPQKEGCDVVNHLDNVRSNNHIQNLEWTTRKGNLDYARKQGRLYRQKNWRRENERDNSEVTHG